MGNRFSLVAVMLSVSTFSCVSLNGVIEERHEGGGTTKVYAVPPSRAYDVAVAALHDADVDAVEEHRDKGYVLCSKGYNFLSYGAVIGVFVEPAGSGSSVT